MISSQDLMVIGFLVFLEGILSIDNALVLALLAKDLPKSLQRKALTYGLVGAVLFRLISLGRVTYLIRGRWGKFVGGGYLLFIAIKNLFFEDKSPHKKLKKSSFWKTVLVIELTDIAFAVDSILAAVALSNKFWIVFTGGVLGLIMMRFAASIFIKMLDRFPAFETTAYLLVLAIGVKVILEGMQIPGIDFHETHEPPFWIFWTVALMCVLYGFSPAKKKKSLESSLKEEEKLSDEISGDEQR